MYGKIKIRSTDKKFSDYIREKADFRCEYCHKLCKVNGEWIAKLEASHYFSRSHENTRFDPMNVYSLCFTCHKNLGGYTRSENGEYDLWVKKKLGLKEYKKLKIRANTLAKRDDKLTALYIQQLINPVKPNKYTDEQNNIQGRWGRS